MLVYSRDATEPEKQLRASGWVDYLWSARQGRISTQVLSEYFVTVTNKLQPGLSIAKATADLIDLATWKPVAIDASLVLQAVDLSERAQLSYWDGLIVSAAQRGGCDLPVIRGSK